MGKHTTGSLYKRGNTYWVAFVHDGKRYRVTTGETTAKKAEKKKATILAPFTARDHAEVAKTLAAKAVQAEVTAAALEAEAAEAARPRLAVADAWARFEASKTRRQCAAGALKDYAARWRRFATWWAGHAPARPAMEEVTLADAEAFVTALDKGELTAHRRNQVVQTCRYVWNVLAKEIGPRNAPPPNPFGHSANDGVKPVAEEIVSRRPLSEGELLEVCGKATGELRLLLALGVFTGARLGDACTMGWQAVDLDSGTLTFRPTKTRRTGKMIKLPMHPTLAAMLAETPSLQRRGDILPETAARYRKDPSAVSKALRRYFESCDITTRVEPTQGQRRAVVSYHSLRSNFATYAARAGVPVAVVSELLGHSPEIERRYYLNFTTADARAAVAAQLDPFAPALPALPAPATAANGPVTRDEALARIGALLTAHGVPAAARAEIAALVERL
jgi:integrase